MNTLIEKIELHDGKFDGKVRNKEFFRSWHIIGMEHLDPNDPGLVARDTFDIRLYCSRGRGERIYCALWFRDPSTGVFYQSTAWAGGYGYDKAGAAIVDALAGIGIRTTFDGAAGKERAISAALEVAQLRGLKGSFVVESFA